MIKAEKIKAEHIGPKACDSCESHDRVQKISIGSEDRLSSFRLCIECRRDLRNIMVNVDDVRYKDSITIQGGLEQ